MEIAREEKMPFMIHSKGSCEGHSGHCEGLHEGWNVWWDHSLFSYAKEMAREYLDMGLYLGIGGVITFKNAKKLKEVVEYAPLSQIVLETDSPYLSPEPNRGNEMTHEIWCICGTGDCTDQGNNRRRGYCRNRRECREAAVEIKIPRK